MDSNKDHKLDNEKYRAWVYDRQGLGRKRVCTSARTALAAYGWQRSVGGANPYLALFARTGEGRACIDALAAELELYELPSARGCTYVLPAEHFALGLALARGGGAATEVSTAKQLGVTDAEIDALKAQVLVALAVGPLSPAALKPSLGDYVRNLGEAGKKKGLTTTLPLALGLLQLEGKIRRKPLNGRLDTQNYAYALWEPALPALPDDDTAAADAAWLFFQWAGAATLQDFREFTGFTARRAQAACAAVGVCEFDTFNTDAGLLCLLEAKEEYHAFDRPSEPAYSLVGNLDSFLLLRPGVQFWLADTDRDQKAPTDKGISTVGSLAERWSHPILDRGRLIGLWEYDPQAECLVWYTWIKPDDSLLATISQTEAQIREELGDVRSFSLDSPISRRPRLDALQALSQI